MCSTIDHPSELTKFYDASRGAHRYKHKGTGVLRDTLMAIGRRFEKKTAKKAAIKAAEKAAETVAKKATKEVPRQLVLLV